MLTPQEVSERAFPKASFGGYNMASVDEFLDQLTEDYTALYKENAALKSKMKVLADKVEEYRSTEDAMRKTLLTAQQMADQMIHDAETKKAAMLTQAEVEATEKAAALRRQVDAEQIRLANVQNAVTVHLSKLRELCQKELEYVSALEKMTPTPAPAPAGHQVEEAAADIEASVGRILAQEEETVGKRERREPASWEGGDTHELPHLGDKEEAEPAEPSGGLYQDLAKARAKAEEEKGEKPAAPKRIDFENLQFGKDFEIE